MPKKLFFLSTLFFIPLIGYNQYKVIRVEPENFYFKFYSGLSKSDYIMNDSIYYLCRKVNLNSFNLDKFVNHKKLWTQLYNIDKRKISMGVITKLTNSSGKSKITIKEKWYYIAHRAK